MKKFISFYYGYESDYRHRIEIIKETGFDGVMALFRFSKSFYQECEEIQKSGLIIDSLHLPFRGIANKLWLSDKQSEVFINEMKEGIDYAASMNINKVTIHTSASKMPPPKRNVAIARIKSLCDYADDKGINVCIENLRRKDYFLYVSDNLNSVNAKICFDIGHMHAFWRGGLSSFAEEVDFSKIVCCHLHDNKGHFDSHLPPYKGTIDWSEACKHLSRMPLDGLTAEVFANRRMRLRTDEKAYLSDINQSLSRIEKEIMCL
ncbi:MAG: sugar phosphate isomerase/epimerase family protein [Christensenellales bacterium]